MTAARSRPAEAPKGYRIQIPDELARVLATFPEEVRRDLDAQLRKAAERAETDFPPTPDWLALMGKTPPVLQASSRGHGVLYNADERTRTLHVRGLLVPKARKPPRGRKAASRRAS